MKSNRKAHMNGVENLPADLFAATIMIVDDEAINIEVVQAFLEDEGYRYFVTVEHSAQAMEKIEDSRPDLLLLDLVMPEVSGFDILAAVRAHPRFKYLPVIILTAATDQQSKITALGLGATDFLAKPLDPSELGLRVRNTLGAKAYQDQLTYYDPLTKLPNRKLFLEDLAWAMNSAARHNDQLALLSIEIDNFENIKDTLGLSAGDKVLRLVAQRIKDVCRNVDTLARVEGDGDSCMSLFHLDSSVFSLLLDRILTADSAAIVAERIRLALRPAVAFEDQELYLTASIGISTFPGGENDPAALLRLASSAKDYAKKLGGNYFQFSSPAINALYEQRLAMETGLRRALANGEFVLYYQPKVELKTGAIAGVEALLRWKNGATLVPPNDFIPLAEETGLIVPIGEWVLAESCSQLKEWHDAGHQSLSMAVNLSVKQFADPGLPERLREIVAESGIDPQFLTLELTESHMLGDIEQKIYLLKQLKEIGLKLSIDDFGTGYSSLNYLRRLPLDELKIDRSFIMETATHANSRAIVSTIIYLASSLNLTTVAEGIETAEELEFLQTQDCHQYQGYLFSRPVPSAELTQLLQG